MNYLRENPVGVDIEINRIQTYLYNQIINRWSLEDFNGYGRVYKNKKSNLIIPEYYVSEKEYEEVLLDDRLNGIMFFSPSDMADVYGNLIIQECDVIFSFNLSCIEFSNEREDEKIRQLILADLSDYKANKDFVKQVQTGLTNVYKDYNGVANYFYDMQKFHHFKITLELRFNNTKCI